MLRMRQVSQPVPLRALQQTRLAHGKAARSQPASQTENQHDAPGRHNRAGDAEGADAEEDTERFHYQYFRTKT